jgi:hypothetical protein
MFYPLVFPYRSALLSVGGRSSSKTVAFESAQVAAQDNGPDVVERLAAAATSDPATVVAVLSELGLADLDIATAVGVTERSVRRWRAGDSERAPLLRRWRRVDDLRAAVLILAEDGSLTLDGIVYWLRARNRHLDHQRPLDVLCRGGFELVREAALRLIDPQGRLTDDG